MKIQNLIRVQRAQYIDYVETLHGIFYKHMCCKGQNRLVRRYSSSARLMDVVILMVMNACAVAMPMPNNRL